MLSHEQIQIKTPGQIHLMRRARLVVVDIHAALRETVCVGITTAEFGAVSAGIIKAAGAYSNFLGYYDYPATVRISANDEVVHGIPDERILADGDLVTFDCSVYIFDEDGTRWRGDVALTTVAGGNCLSGTDRFVDTTVRQAPWGAIAAIAHAVAGEGRGRQLYPDAAGGATKTVVADVAKREGHKLGILQEHVGHGIGTSMRMAPDVLNYPAKRCSARLRSGMVLAVEPILTASSLATYELGDGWTAVTRNDSHTVQWKHIVAAALEDVWVLVVSDGGAEDLTPYGVEPKALG